LYSSEGEDGLQVVEKMHLFLGEEETIDYELSEEGIEYSSESSDYGEDSAEDEESVEVGEEVEQADE